MLAASQLYSLLFLRNEVIPSSKVREIQCNIDFRELVRVLQVDSLHEWALGGFELLS
jgi:hypothetical protein